MKEHELKKLNRAELLELLIAQMKENERLAGENEKLRTSLEDRRLELREAGSIAEAALKVNRVFEAAEAAAAQYLENIRRLSDGASAAEREEPILREARERASEIVAQAKKDAQRIRDEALFTWDL